MSQNLATFGTFGGGRRKGIVGHVGTGFRDGEWQQVEAKRAKVAERGFCRFEPLFFLLARCFATRRQYNLILGMIWIEHREQWVDRCSTTFGATRTAPRGDLKSHEPTSARNQKRYWQETIAENVSVLDI